MAMPSSRSLRVAYLCELYPSRSETWVHHEVRELRALGAEVQAFATFPRPEVASSEWPELMEHATYLAERSFGELLRGFVALLRPTVLGPYLRGAFTDAPGLRAKLHLARNLYWLAGLLPAIRAFEPDVCVVHLAGARSNMALLLELSDGVPFALKTHSGDVFERQNLFRLTTQRCAALLTISHYNVEFMQRHHPDADLSRVAVHACGIPLDTFAYAPCPSPPEPPLLLSVGRLVGMKGFHVLVRAASLLRERGVACRVTIVGEGEEHAALSALVRELDIGDRVTLEGYGSPERVRELLPEASLFVLGCVWNPKKRDQDGIPMVLMEAMAVGVPVVSTRLSGIPELIEEGRSGWLAEPDDPAALANAIERGLAVSADERLAVQRAARATIEERHDIRLLTHDLHERLQRLVAERAERA
jgi:colanic acid/amylovoran biosynthesis glycosyltransferase